MLTERPLPRVWTLEFSWFGLVFALLFFGFSLLPSLLPRTPMFQGVVSGVTVVVGYGVGTGLHWLWRFLQIPPLTGRLGRVVRWVSIGLVAAIVLSSIWDHVGWQNDVRDVFGMDPVSPIRWLPVSLFTILVAAILLILSRSIWKLYGLLSRWLSKWLPERSAIALGIVVLGAFMYLLVSGVLINGFFEGANVVFSTRDTATAAEVIQPESELRSGSEASLAAWDTLGRQGRSFVATGPTIDDLNELHGSGAIEPIRVYAGLKSADSVEGRAQLVLDELVRTNAFDREVLIVATTTGTGFLDEDAVDPLEYIYNGDSAIVGVQYSYLPSWISLLADQEAVKETSQVVFEAIHAYWTDLDEDERPELYLYGLSLGTLGVESILTSVNIINEPIDGAFMAGPPFVNPLHDKFERNRDPGSAQWRPIYQNGRTVQFTSQESGFGIPAGPWGPTRIAYLQHGSDPVVFFNAGLAFSIPDWLFYEDQRPPDVSSEMVWVPVITMWQVAADLPAAGSVPEGFAHLYQMVENADAWIAMTDPDGWTDEDTVQLNLFLAQMQEERADA